MSEVWITIGALALATTALKLAGPLLLGGRPLPASAMSIIELLASALLAALIVVETFGKGRSLTLDARDEARELLGFASDCSRRRPNLKKISACGKLGRTW